MSASRRERKLQRAARERTHTLFGRVFAPDIDRMEPIAHKVLLLCLPAAVMATEQPHGERFRWFLQQLPDELLQAMNTVTYPSQLERGIPTMAPVLIVFTAWARMMLYGKAETDWHAPMTREMEADGARYVLWMTQLERVARLGAYDRYEYPNDPWDAEAEIQAEGRHEEVFERLRQEDEAARAEDPDWLPPLDPTQLPFKIADAEEL